jgi:hypothetical protein
MKEFASAFFKHLSGYVVTLRSVTSNPTRAITDRIINKRNKLNKAFVFVAMTLAIGFAFQVHSHHPDRSRSMPLGLPLAQGLVALVTHIANGYRKHLVVPSTINPQLTFPLGGAQPIVPR